MRRLAALVLAAVALTALLPDAASAGGHLIATDQFNAMGRDTQRVAITRGTGAYRSARGEVAIRQASDTRGTAVFTIVTG